MIRERGEPAIADTSKPIIEPPVFPEYRKNTQKTRAVAQDPDLLGDDEDEDDDLDLDDEDEVVDEFDEDIESKEVIIEDTDDLLLDDDDDDDF
jgi:hypothetical protein